MCLSISGRPGGPCVAEIPQRQARLPETYKGKGFEVLGISLDDDDALKMFVADKGLSARMIHDAPRTTGSSRNLASPPSPPSSSSTSEGTIIATGLRGEAPGKELAELLP
ncbi:MAG: redoxin domain-containing protein [Kiritimatiellia bacterium]